MKAPMITIFLLSRTGSKDQRNQENYRFMRAQIRKEKAG